MAKKEQTRYEDWNDVDQGLRRIGEIDIALTRLEGEQTLRINEVKEEYDAKSQGLRSERRRVTEAITAFVEERKDEFLKTRSRELTFGTVAYRIVSRIVIRSKAATVAALEALGLFSYLRVTKEPDKEAMTALDAGTLAKVGATLKTEDKLRIEPNMERIADREAANG